jgi:O-antigen ligase
MLLLPFGRTVEAAVLLMAIYGSWGLIKDPRSVIKDPSARLFSLVFACAWIPMLASLPDAVAVDRTAMAALYHLRFWLSGLFMIRVLAQSQARRLFFFIGTAVLLAWLGDAVLQHFTGHDILGYAAYSGRLGAMFGPGNTKFGLTLAVLAPLMWHGVRARFGPTAAAVTIVLTVAVVFVAGSRAGWICVLVASASWLLMRSALTGKRAIKLAFALALVGVLGIGLGYSLSDRVKQRIDESLAIFDSSSENLHNSLIHRTWIWGGAMRMIAQHPVNGVGARGFRNAFADFARDDDPYLKMQPPQSPTHSHQLIIEILAETGVLGLGGLLMLWTLLINAYRHADSCNRALLAAPAAALVAAYFPVNTHLAIYSSYWSQIVWFLLGLYCALCARRSMPANNSDNARHTRALLKHC